MGGCMSKSSTSKYEKGLAPRVFNLEQRVWRLEKNADSAAKAAKLRRQAQADKAAARRRQQEEEEEKKKKKRQQQQQVAKPKQKSMSLPSSAHHSPRDASHPPPGPSKGTAKANAKAKAKANTGAPVKQNNNNNNNSNNNKNRRLESWSWAAGDSYDNMVATASTGPTSPIRCVADLPDWKAVSMQDLGGSGSGGGGRRGAVVGGAEGGGLPDNITGLLLLSPVLKPDPSLKVAPLNVCKKK